jgi:tRNA-2-methylthio-N6-dimethylallyladenosine synthase
VESVCAAGVREVTLLGQTVEAYGKDLETNGLGRKPDLADLFAAIHETPGVDRIRFLTSYPRDMTERIVRSVAEFPKVCEHFNIPLQAGDNTTLEAMRRGYTIEQYLEWVYRIREIVPGSAMSTDVIVGFCGETEAQFQRTLDVLAEVRFDKVHVAAYSTRPGTIAWRRMEDDIPQDEKMRRLHAIEEVQERIATEINATFNGTVQEVLIEGARANEDGETIYTGRSRGNKLVHFRAAEGSPETGALVDVLVSKTTPWSLQGEASVPVHA